MSLKKVVVALDWTPNTVHTPLLIAKSKGFYEEAGLDVHFVSPDMDDYATTPARRVLNGNADFAICPSESVIAYAESSSDRGTPERLQAVFALLDQDASSILCSSSIQRPKDLDGKVYGSYNARYEDGIIRAMVRKDGGTGDITIDKNTAKLNLFEALTTTVRNEGTGEASTKSPIDATWIFSPWEGIQASQMGFIGKKFRLEDYGIPYGYAPVLARSQAHALSDMDAKKFLGATAKGYSFALEHSKESLDVLEKYCPNEASSFLSTSLDDIRRHWRSRDFGFMEKQKWDAFLSFLREEQLIRVEFDSENLFINL